MQFNDVIGQDALKDHIKSAIRLNKVSHAYIINGEAGYGKLKLAKVFAQALLCDKKAAEPCDNCINCTKANHNNHPDIIYISHEKPQLISAKEIREQLVDTVDIRPYESRRKIYIIDDAEFINETGQNILLKTIEEPPEYITILILTTNKDKLLPTVQSRCVILNMMPVQGATIKEYLMREGIVDYQADMANVFAGGNPGKAYLIAHDNYFLMRLIEVCDIMKNLKGYSSKDISQIAVRLDEDKEHIDIYLDLMMTLLRDMLVYKTTQREDKIKLRQEMLIIKDMSSRLTLSNINRMIVIISDTVSKINAGVTLVLTIEMMLHNMMTVMDE